jgi:hypothetical protein
MPVSKEDFIINLAAVLNSDKHRGSIQGIRTYLFPPTPPVVTVPTGGPPVPAPPAPAPVPVPVPAPPAPAPPAPAPAPKPKGTNNKINYSPEVGLAVTTLNLLLDKKRVPKATNAEVTAAEEHLGDLAVKENLDKEDLARRIYAAPRRPLKVGELDYAERIILQSNARANAAAAAAASFKTPVKGPPTFVLTPYKLDLKTRMTAEIANYKAIHNNKMPDPKTVAHIW